MNGEQVEIWKVTTLIYFKALSRYSLSEIETEEEEEEEE